MGGLCLFSVGGSRVWWTQWGTEGEGALWQNDWKVRKRFSVVSQKLAFPWFWFEHLDTIAWKNWYFPSKTRSVEVAGEKGEDPRSVSVTLQTQYWLILYQKVWWINILYIYDHQCHWLSKRTYYWLILSQ